jgi:DNA-binding NarL/FixJ family response regulator
MSDTMKAARQRRPQPARRAGLKVLIADEHFLLREGLKVCLQSIETDITIFEADTLDAAVSTCRSYLDIDLVLFALGMSAPTSIDALETFMRAWPADRIAVLSARNDPTAARSALDKGVRGYIPLPRSTDKEAFIQALRTVLAGSAYEPPELPVNPSPTAADALRNARFTARQMEVLAHLIEGKPNKQICKELNLALGTVKTHVGAILGALEVSSRAEAIVRAEKSGLRGWLEKTHADDGPTRR